MVFFFGGLVTWELNKVNRVIGVVFSIEMFAIVLRFVKSYIFKDHAVESN